MARCIQCQQILQNDEISIYKKLVNKMADQFLCKICLAKKLDCDPQLIDMKIKQFRDIGCFLFPPIEGEN